MGRSMTLLTSLTVLLAAWPAWGQGGSTSMESPCYSDPSAAACASFTRADADWQADLSTACAAAPYLTGCSLRSICKSQGSVQGYCTPSSLAAVVCVDAPQASWYMELRALTKGCEAYAALCAAAGSVVQQCSKPGIVPKAVPTKTARDWAESICDEMPEMDDCPSCTGTDPASFTTCPNPLLSYGRLCYSMPTHYQCADWEAFCGQSEVASAFPEVCTGKTPAVSAADGPAAASPAPAPTAATTSAPAKNNTVTPAAATSTTSSASSPSVNMSSPCYTAPSAPDCAAFERTVADWNDDLAKLCAAMPFMSGCSLANICKGQDSTTGLCAPSSLVADICQSDPSMSRMKGCEAWNGLCATGSVVPACTTPGPVPNLITTYGAKAAIDSICTEMYMSDCDACTERGQKFQKCPDPLVTFGRLCYSMPQMWQCYDTQQFGSWEVFCDNSEAAATFPDICGGSSADGSTQGLPPMKMYMHQTTREIMLFKEWVPESTGAYVGAWFGFFFLAIFTQGLKALRLTIEMKWARQLARRCTDIESGRRGCCQGNGVVAAAAATNGHTSNGNLSNKGSADDVPPCCGGNGFVPEAKTQLHSKPACCSSAEDVPARGGRLAAGTAAVRAWARGLMTPSQARRNSVRAAFSFVVVFIDYMLMLVVMTFNVGIIFAVVGGFAIGTFMFGHIGEPKAAAVDAPPERDVETPFVMSGGDCCSGCSLGCNSSQA